MGRCKYGEPIRKRQQEALEEQRRRAPSDFDPDSRDIVVVDEVEGDEDGRDEDEDEGDKDEEEEDEGGGDGGDEDEDQGGKDEGDEDEDEVPVPCNSHWWTPSPLTPLDGKAVKPKVGDDRVAYAKGTNRGAPSDMTMGELLSLAKHFPWPRGVELRLPRAGGGALAKYPGCIVVYEEALKGPYISAKSISKRKRGVLIKRRKKSLSLRKDLASTNPHKRPMVVCSVSSAPVQKEIVGITREEEEPDEEEEEEEEEEEDPEEEEEEQVEEEENVGIAHEEEEEKDEEEEELASTRPLEMSIDHALGNSTHVHGEKEVSHEDGNDVPFEGEKFPSFPTGFGGTSSISTLCRPEVTTSLRRLLPDIILAAQHSETLEHQLNESRQEIVELKREKAELERQLIEKDREFRSRIERMEQDKKTVEEELIETQAKLAQTAQKAKELLDISSTLVMKR